MQVAFSCNEEAGAAARRDGVPRDTAGRICHEAADRIALAHLSIVRAAFVGILLSEHASGRCRLGARGRQGISGLRAVLQLLRRR
jgi:hypothetical protein